MSKVKSIGMFGFSECAALTTIGDLRNLTSIGDFAFNGCYNLTLRVLRNSYAARYAQSKGISYVYIQ